MSPDAYAAAAADPAQAAAPRGRRAQAGPPLSIVVKGYPRLSETFIAQELKALEARGFQFDIWSLRKPYDGKTHPIHEKIRAQVNYLPEYLHEEAGRVIAAFIGAMFKRGFLNAFAVFLGDLMRDFSRNRVRRFGQACVMATERPKGLRFVYAHFLHTPSSVARYAAMIHGVRWGFSAHARDIWTTPSWEKTAKIDDAAFGVTCTRIGQAQLNALSSTGPKVELAYHGLDLSDIPRGPETREPRNGTVPGEHVQLISVGRAVEKKGYMDLLNALADLPKIMQWRFTHIGGGPEMEALKARAKDLGLSGKIKWLGKRDRPEVIEALRAADIFIMPSRIASDGDRDGLPNVILEAASQNLAIIATRLSAIPEFVEHDVTGVLVRPGHAAGMTEAIQQLARDPNRRANLGVAARARLEIKFGPKSGIEVIAKKLRAGLGAPAPASATEHPAAPAKPAAETEATAAKAAAPGPGGIRMAEALPPAAE
ncbi:MAG: glycosyltransferase family 4 protein [Rubrimonas sp.]|uniref:glycosyltransferase family 4 protein n=1 Tax=Rubrimonas sp. TaxID=2036015 RepID=UPI002FDC7D6B